MTEVRNSETGRRHAQRELQGKALPQKGIRTRRAVYSAEQGSVLRSNYSSAEASPVVFQAPGCASHTSIFRSEPPPLPTLTEKCGFPKN
jgi:hypothetical protein